MDLIYEILSGAIGSSFSTSRESKQYEISEISREIAENKIKVEREQQAIKKHAEGVYAGKNDGLPIEMPVSGLTLTEAMKKAAAKQDVIAEKLCSGADDFDLSLRQKGKDINKTKLFIENAIDKIKREGMK